MNEKRIPLENDEPKHKKKAQKKSVARSDHKHIYKTVLLHRLYDDPFHAGSKRDHQSAAKVCEICGRVGDRDEDAYEKIRGKIGFSFEIKDPDSLEQWYVENYCEKFAHKMEEV